MSNVSDTSKSVMWKPTPMDKKLPNAGWSDDAIVRFYDVSGDTFEDKVVYVLYWDNVDNMTYLKDIREDVLYSLPSGAKAKGYTLAFKLNLNHVEKK